MATDPNKTSAICYRELAGYSQSDIGEMAILFDCIDLHKTWISKQDLAFLYVCFCASHECSFCNIYVTVTNEMQSCHGVNG